MKRSLLHLRIPLREPFATSRGELTQRELLVLRLEEDGLSGYGEAAPLEPYDDISLERAAEALRATGRDDAPPQALAAEELARLDLEGRRTGVPLAEARASVVPVNYTLPAGPPARAAQAAVRAREQGYDCFKLKAGLPDDGERVAAVREAIGPEAALRLDANGAWSADQALAALDELGRFGLELVEQPCASVEELARVRAHTGVPIAADESATTAAELLAASGACDLVCVKLARSGGFERARAAIRAARENGLEPYLASNLDGPWGIAAALQLAAAEGIVRHSGLATLELFDATLAAALPPPEHGRLPVPPGPGLGVSVDDEAIAEVLVGEEVL